MGLKILRSRCQQSHTPSKASREESFVACPSLWGCWHSLACGHTSLCSVFTSPPPTPCICLFFCLKCASASLWKRHLSLKLEPTQVNQDNLKIHNLITPAMTLFPNKLTFIDLEIWRGSPWAGHFLIDLRHLRSSTKCTSELPISRDEEQRINPPHPSPVGQGLYRSVNRLEPAGCAGRCECWVHPAGTRDLEWKTGRGSEALSSDVTEASSSSKVWRRRWPSAQETKE